MVVSQPISYDRGFNNNVDQQHADSFLNAYCLRRIIYFMKPSRYSSVLETGNELRPISEILIYAEIASKAVGLLLQKGRPEIVTFHYITELSKINNYLNF